MLNRQKSVLCLLHHAGGGASRLQLVKWCFLMGKESPSLGGTSYYDFLPFRFGPYSFTLKHEIGCLIRDGLLLPVGEDRWELTSAGKKATATAPSATHSEAIGIVSRYGKMSTGDLLDSVYGRYGWYTVNSEYIDKRRQSRPIAKPSVYTVGYEGQSVDGFFDGLMRSGIKALLDVRYNPVARRFGFHKSTLTRLCSSLDIEYVHFPELGIPSSLRCDLATEDDYAKLLHRYDQEILPNKGKFVRAVADIVTRRPSAVMCMERDPQMCHRSRVAAAVSKLTALPTVHLRGVEDDRLRQNKGSDYRPYLSPSFA